MLDQLKTSDLLDGKIIVLKDIASYLEEPKIDIQTSDILEAIKNTYSLSQIMEDALEKMKKEYETRKFKNASRR